MLRRLLTRFLGCWLIAVAMAGSSHAQQPKGRQHLVNPGDDWSQLADQLRPGDEIILMPGVHRPAVLDDLRGTHERPIIIKSLTAEHPATINAAMALPGAGGAGGTGSAGSGGGRHGLLLRRTQHVIVQDLIITGATLHGIEASGARETSEPANQGPSLTLRHVTVTHVGPIGRRNGLLLRNLDRVIIEQCAFEGWGGSAVELVACNDVSIEKCSFRGLEDYSQMNAVQIRAGSERVRIEDCLMIDAGVTAVAMGGQSSSEEFRGPASANPRPEAARVRVTRNLVRGGHSAVAFINCDQCIARNNTIVRPQRWVYLILDNDGPQLAPSRRCTFASNLIHWQPGDLQRFSHLRDGAAANGLTLDQNLWWSADLEKARSRLGELAGSSQFPQVMDVNPQLDDRYLPTEPQAMMFGRGTR